MQTERQARRRLHDERRRGDAYLQRALRARARLWRAPLLLTGLSFSAPFLAAVLGYFLGYREGRYGQAGYIWLLGVGVVHFFTSILLESRKEEELRALLRARPPAHAGGPPVCRVCAAPLSVPKPRPDDLSCDHCGADNILGDDGDLRPPRPDLLDAEAVYCDVYGDAVNQRASRLYPLTILLGFLLLALLTYYAVEAPTPPSAVGGISSGAKKKQP